ncbi:hypothetical protein SAMN04488519_10739 [Algoriphagus ornithinivorans]|uniref:Dolichyl-phosphate-mannose-protein mannosyltransferase n=2 Tax=Algoriphagus ornithinivorans TaxID=226506 RepID=A0A1I5HH51_9BACT|nr:hypothetical protein SAMN04488519_10739 [Algoriphagus ornithinivorans]
MWLVSGSYTGEPETYTVFIHPLLTWFFAFFYQLIPFVSWYSIFIFSLLGISYAIGTISIDSYLKNTSKKALYKSILLIITLHFCIFPQFTLVAGWAAFHAFFILSFSFKEFNRNTFLGLLLLLFGALFRLEATILIFLGFLAFSFYLHEGHKNWKLIGCVILIFVLMYGSQKIWEQQSIHQEYLKFNQARHEVIDHPVFYQMYVNKEFPKDSKWFYFSFWLIEESTVSIEELYEYKEDLNAQYLEGIQIKNSFFRLYDVLSKELFKSFFISLLLILYFLKFRRESKPKIILAAWLIFFLVFNHFFHIRGRVVFLFFIPLIFPLIQNRKEYLSTNLIRITSAIIWILFIAHFGNFLREAKKRRNYILQYESLVSDLPAQPIKLEGIPLEYFSKYFHPTSNIPFLLDGWMANSIFQKKAYKKWNFNSLKEINHYYLIGLKNEPTFNFADYLSSENGEYKLINERETEDLILFEYKKQIIP